MLLWGTTNAHHVIRGSYSSVENDALLCTERLFSTDYVNCEFGESQTEDDDDNEIFLNVDIEPEFPGGVKSLMEFISSNLRYPAFAAENGIQGKVRLTFVVEKDGSISNIQELSSPFEDLTREAMRVLHAMPRWKPGMLHGAPARVKFMLPITFRLDTANTQRTESPSKKTIDDFEHKDYFATGDSVWISIKMKDKAMSMMGYMLEEKNSGHEIVRGYIYSGENNFKIEDAIYSIVADSKKDDEKVLLFDLTDNTYIGYLLETDTLGNAVFYHEKDNRYYKLTTKPIKKRIRGKLEFCD